MKIRPSKVVIAAIAGLATIIGIWEPVLAERLTVGAPPSLRPALSEILAIEQSVRPCLH